MNEQEALEKLLLVVTELRLLHHNCDSSSCPWPSMWEQDVKELAVALRRNGLVLRSKSE